MYEAGILSDFAAAVLAVRLRLPILGIACAINKRLCIRSSLYTSNPPMFTLCSYKRFFTLLIFDGSVCERS